MAPEELDTPLELVRALSVTQKLAVAHQLWETARELTAAGIRARRPSLTEQQVQSQVREVFRRAVT